MNLGAATLIDLSIALGPSPAEIAPVEIDYIGHDAGGAHLAELVSLRRDQLPGGQAWASERVSALTHSGTHMDSPYHYGPRSGRRRSRTIDELPVGWFWGRGICVPVAGGGGRGRPRRARQGTERQGTERQVEERQLEKRQAKGRQAEERHAGERQADEWHGEEPVELAELAAFERAAGVAIAAGDIVLFRTGAEDWHGDASYWQRGRPLAPAVVRELLRRGVRVLGTDAWSVDPSPAGMRRQLEREGPGAVWAAHYAGSAGELCVIERLANLHRLPATGFWVACFPIKVLRASGGWVRPVAFVAAGENGK